MNHPPGHDDLQLADYAGVLRRRWWLIFALAVIGTLASVGYFKVSHKVYIATASVYVTGNGETANQAAAARTTGTVNLDTEAQVVQSATVAQAAAKLMHATETLPQLIKRVSVTVPANSQVLSISCQASSASVAATCAQSFAQAFLSYTSSSTIASANSQISALQSKISALESASAKLTVEVGSLPDNSPQRAAAQEQLNSDQGQLSSLNSQVAQLTAELTNPSGGSIISNAIPPSSASSPKPLLIFPSGLLAGLLIGLILSFIVDRRDRRVRSSRDLMKINVPVLMSLPQKRSAVELAIASPRSQVGRDFSGLAHLLTSSLGTGSHVILVTGASAGNGVSLVAANLAVSLSRNQPDVTLVCADLERSLIPAMVGLPSGPGLTDLLAAGSPIRDAGDQVAVAPRLRVITPGSAARIGTEDLQLDAVERLMASLRSMARWIIVEAPSVASGPDAYTLAQTADTAILVVEVPRTRSDQVLDNVEYLERMGANVFGAAVLRPPKASVPREPAVPAETSREPAVPAETSHVPLGRQVAPPVLSADTVPVPSESVANGHAVPFTTVLSEQADEDQTMIVNWSAGEEAPSSSPRG
jgi:capsular polysaccharide biosynthesis protein/MinD-like ATPase involved in chromosome partitioning or flagellar assembly